MFWRWLLYFLWLSVFGLLFLFTGNAVIFMMTLLLIVCVIMSFFATAQLKKAEITIDSENRQLLYTSSSALPFVFITLTIIKDNIFLQTSSQEQIRFFTGKKRIEIPFSLETNPGRYHLSIDKLQVCDFLGMLERTMEKPDSQDIIVYPSVQESSQMLCRQIESFSVQGEETSHQTMDGALTDKHEVREYQIGDPLHRIHHKLSYKLSKTMIREFANEQKKEPLFYVILDFNDIIPEVIQTMNHLAYIVNYSLQNEYLITVIWYVNNRFETRTIENNEHAIACFHAILSNKKQSLPAIASMDIINCYLLNARGMHPYRNEMKGEGR